MKKGLSFALCCAILGCQQGQSSDGEAVLPPSGEGFLLWKAERPILNGTVENGFDAVGALVWYNFNTHYYGGELCTATLIAPQWILTASHCFNPEVAGTSVTTSNTAFFMGQDARGSSGGGAPTGGQVYGIAEIFMHPNYGQMQSSLYDVALVRLVSPITSIPTIPIFDGDLTAYIGQSLKTVGYGRTSYSGYNNDGPMRLSTSLTLKEVHTQHLVARGSNSGICPGDSGGPQMVHSGGEYRIVGVNSALLLDTYPSGDRCLSNTSISRVDVMQSWIRSVMGENVNCNDSHPACACSDACQVTGVCDPLRCNKGYNCLEIADCANRCNNLSCTIACETEGNLTSIGVYDAFSQCWGNCYAATGNNSCYSTSCGSEWNACVTDRGRAREGDGRCADGLDCMINCDGDEDCESGCLDGLGRQDFVTLNALRYNLQTSCGTYSSILQQIENCRTVASSRLHECIPTIGCDRVGGDCPSGTGCYLTEWEDTVCFASKGRLQGAPCESSRDCADGYACIPSGDSKRCTHSCWNGNDCMSAHLCNEDWLFTEGAGACMPRVGCTDEDLDGHCSEEDCDDRDHRLWDDCEIEVDGGIGEEDAAIEEDSEIAEDAEVIEDGAIGEDAVIEEDAVVIEDAAVIERDSAAAQDADPAEAFADAHRTRIDSGYNPGPDPRTTYLEDDGCNALPKSGSPGAAPMLLLPLALGLRRRSR